MGGMDMPGMAPAPWTADLSAAWLMWLLMMVAMMLPSAAPMILVYARLARTADAQGGVVAPTLAFAGVYMATWATFSLIAAGAQLALAHSGLVTQGALAIGDGRIAGGLLIAAGLYQLTPLKRACLSQCRSPLSFLMRLWRPGWTSALRLGLTHGLFCIGCCGLLMALLFVGGVMNLAWVAALAVIVLFEKVAPIGDKGATAIGAMAILAGLAAISGLPLRL